MTNITLSINDETYIKMKKYSEIKWSEYVRKAIESRIEELESIYETKSLMNLSESVFKEEWDNEYDSRWDNV